MSNFSLQGKLLPYAGNLGLPRLHNLQTHTKGQGERISAGGGEIVTRKGSSLFDGIQFPEFFSLRHLIFDNIRRVKHLSVIGTKLVCCNQSAILAKMGQAQSYVAAIEDTSKEKVPTSSMQSVIAGAVFLYSLLFCLIP